MLRPGFQEALQQQRAVSRQLSELNEREQELNQRTADLDERQESLEEWSVQLDTFRTELDERSAALERKGSKSQPEAVTEVAELRESLSQAQVDFEQRLAAYTASEAVFQPAGTRVATGRAPFERTVGSVAAAGVR